MEHKYQPLKDIVCELETISDQVIRCNRYDIIFRYDLTAEQIAPYVRLQFNTRTHKMTLSFKCGYPENMTDIDRFNVVMSEMNLIDDGMGIIVRFVRDWPHTGESFEDSMMDLPMMTLCLMEDLKNQYRLAGGFHAPRKLVRRDLFETLYDPYTNQYY